MPGYKRALLWILGLSMIGVGVLHFVRPAPFVRIVPDWLPAPEALVYVSGSFEVLGGVGVLLPATRRWAAWGLVALYVAVFPANIHMAIHEIQFEPGGDMPAWAMWARLPLQAVFIAWAWWFTRPPSASG